MKPLIISCSLHPVSRSRILSHELKAMLSSAQLIDLQEWELPFCDGTTCYENDQVGKLKEQIEQADAVVFAFPVYNYGSNSVLKNLIELVGKSLSHKVVGFLCAAGGKSSYLAPLSIANSLMVDFRCVILPRYVYATAADFNKERTVLENEDIRARLEQFKQDFVKLSCALKDVSFD